MFLTLLRRSARLPTGCRSFGTGQRSFNAQQSPLFQLRQRTGLAYNLCREALNKHNNDINQAEVWLQAQASLNREPDFSAKDHIFSDFTVDLAERAARSKDGFRVHQSHADSTIEESVANRDTLERISSQTSIHGHVDVRASQRKSSDLDISAGRFGAIVSLKMNNLIPESQLNMINLINKRLKRTKSRSSKNDEDEDDEEDDDDVEENPLLMDDLSDGPMDGSQRLVIDVNSLRLDAVGKMGFAITRAKMEELFYKGDIYVNGVRATKKSQDLYLGDEIDLVKQVNPEDRTKLDVKRIHIVKMPDKATEQGRMKITIDRWSDLTIDMHDRGE